MYLDVPDYLIELADEYIDRLIQTGKKDFNDLLKRAKPEDREYLASSLSIILSHHIFIRA